MYNFGYNPYLQNKYIGIPQPMQQPMQQTQQEIFNTTSNRPVLNGKPVEGGDVVKAMDIPMDGTINYFPTSDGTEIYTKQFQMDGTIKTLKYKLNSEENISKPLTHDDLTDLKKEIISMRKDIKELIKHDE